MVASSNVVAAKAKDSPTAWFVTLEEARRREDHEAAAQAIRQLRRLGVEVRFVRTKPAEATP